MTGLSNMDKCKIAITGSAGFIGKNLFKTLSQPYTVSGISRRISPTTTHSCDITLQKIHPVLDEIQPKIIVHCAALTNVDFCEENPGQAWLMNVTGTYNLVEWCRRNNAKMIYISTDYVYAGETNNYNESSECAPVDEYGRTKLAAEYLVRSLPNHLILRPTVVFGYEEDGKNFFMQMLALKEPRKIIDDQLSNPTDAQVLSEYVQRAIEKDIEGIYVATGPETINRYDFAMLIAEVFNIDKKLILRTKTHELNQKAKRPLSNGTSSSKIREILKYACPTLRDSLVQYKKNMEENGLLKK